MEAEGIAIVVHAGDVRALELHVQVNVDNGAILDVLIDGRPGGSITIENRHGVVEIELPSRGEGDAISPPDIQVVAENGIVVLTT
jgi:hypothetical protein